MKLNRHAFRVRPGMRQGLQTEVPIPTRLVSNEEFPPLPQTAAQREVEQRILAAAGRLAPRLGLSRREFLRTSGGMATVVPRHERGVRPLLQRVPKPRRPIRRRRRRGPAGPSSSSTCSCTTSGRRTTRPTRRPTARARSAKGRCWRLRKRAQQMNPKLASDSGTMADLSWQNFIKEVFLDSETAIGLISTPPGPYPQEAVVPPKEMTHIRDEINRITQSRRMLAHGLVTPQLGQTDLDFMEMQAETLKIDAWKAYTGSCPKGFDRGWFVDDEKIAYPMLEKARKLGVRRFCVHKGLPLGPSPTTTIRAT